MDVGSGRCPDEPRGPRAWRHSPRRVPRRISIAPLGVAISFGQRRLHSPSCRRRVRSRSAFTSFALIALMLAPRMSLRSLPARCPERRAGATAGSAGAAAGTGLRGRRRLSGSRLLGRGLRSGGGLAAAAAAGGSLLGGNGLLLRLRGGSGLGLAAGALLRLRLATGPSPRPRGGHAPRPRDARAQAGPSPRRPYRRRGPRRRRRRSRSRSTCRHGSRRRYRGSRSRRRPGRSSCRPGPITGIRRTLGLLEPRSPSLFRSITKIASGTRVMSLTPPEVRAQLHKVGLRRHALAPSAAAAAGPSTS